MKKRLVDYKWVKILYMNDIKWRKQTKKKSSDLVFESPEVGVSRTVRKIDTTTLILVSAHNPPFSLSPFFNATLLPFSFPLRETAN